LPLFVDLTYILLDMFEAYGSDANDLLRLVMLFKFGGVECGAGMLCCWIEKFLDAVSAFGGRRIGEEPTPEGYSRGSLPAAFRRQDAILSITNKLSSALSQQWTYTLCMLCILNELPKELYSA
jgi:hypothetical protein